ncbi:MAG: hypothetical protein ACFFBH_08470 [Promethearchaeota archaeon]
MSGGYNTQILVVKRQWQSMVQIEKAYVKAVLDSDYQKLTEKIKSIIEWEKIELPILHPPFPE